MGKRARDGRRAGTIKGMPDLAYDTLPVHCTPQPQLGQGLEGPAVRACVVDTETRDLWVHDGACASKVMFCPYCGKPAGAVVEPAEEGLLDRIRRAADRIFEPLVAPAAT